jgi:hypothetical protein
MTMGPATRWQSRQLNPRRNMNVIAVFAESLRTAAEVPPTSSAEWWNVAAQAILALSLVLLAALSWLSLQAAGLIKAKVKHENVRGTLLRLDDAVFVAVRQIQQVVVDQLKAASADGTLTADERRQVKMATLEAVRSYVGPKGVLEICRIMGLKDDELERVLGPRVEAAVFELNARKVTNGVH